VRLASAAWAVLLIGLVPTWATRPVAQTEPLRVLASNGVKAVMEGLLPESERVAGRPLSTTFDTSAAIRQSISAGEPFDVAILTTETLDNLATTGGIVAGSVAALGQSGIGIGVRTGAARPDIATPAALERALLQAPSLTYAGDGASRVHISRMLDVLGIAEAVKGKTVLEQGSVRATSRVATGETTFVITLISEILPISGIELLGPLPPEFQNYVSFAAGVGSKARAPEAARALVAFLAGPRTRPAFLAKGIDRP